MVLNVQNVRKVIILITNSMFVNTAPLVNILIAIINAYRIVQLNVIYVQTPLSVINTWKMLFLQVINAFTLVASVLEATIINALNAILPQEHMMPTKTPVAVNHLIEKQIVKTVNIIQTQVLSFK